VNANAQNPENRDLSTHMYTKVIRPTTSEDSFALFCIGYATTERERLPVDHLAQYI
jgi:hypothetical protein